MTSLFLILSVASTLAAGPRSAPTIRESLAFSIASGPQISPDGKTVVYQVSRTNWQENEFDGDLWTASVGDPQSARKLDLGPGWNGDARWSPDGKSLAFLSDRRGHRQIYVVPAEGGTVRKLTSARSGITEFHWAPNSQAIAFTADEAVASNGDFEVVNEKRSKSRLWQVEIPKSADEPVVPPQRLLREDLYAGGFAWSPSGDRIAIQSDGIYILDIGSGAATRVVSGAGPYRNPMWSPDGNSIAFETAGGAAGFYYANWYIAKAPAAGGAAEPVTRDFDENAQLESWTPSGIFFSALQRTASHLFVADPATHAIRRVTSPVESVNQQFSISRDGARAAFVRYSATGLPEIFVANLDGTETRLTDNSGQTSGFRFAQRELVRWKSTDGTEIEGVLFRPADFDASKKYPLLVDIHGGPVAVDQPVMRPDRNYPLEQFVERGALVLRPNYRGSAGYGAKLRALPVRNLGAGDAADINSGVDYLVGKGFVDPDRIGVMGWSEGGYISAYLATTTNRYAAVSVGAGISDWLAYYSETDIPPFARQYLKSTPWSEPDTYRKASPITYINKACTPVLIQHGDEDARVPISNAYELRQALEDRQIPVRMVVYKGFGHSVDRPRQQEAVMQHNLDWFERWVFNKSTEPQPAITISQAQALKATAGDNVH